MLKFWGSELYKKWVPLGCVVLTQQNSLYAQSCQYTCESNILYFYLNEVMMISAQFQSTSNRTSTTSQILSFRNTSLLRFSILFLYLGKSFQKLALFSYRVAGQQQKAHLLYFYLIGSLEEEFHFKFFSIPDKILIFLVILTPFSTLT